MTKARNTDALAELARLREQAGDREEAEAAGPCRRAPCSWPSAVDTTGPPASSRQGAVGRSSVAAQVVEEVLDDVELPGACCLVVDVFADGEVEYSEAEG